jgi:hypothetical protein
MVDIKKVRKPGTITSPSKMARDEYILSAAFDEDLFINGGVRGKDVKIKIASVKDYGKDGAQVPAVIHIYGRDNLESLRELITATLEQADANEVIEEFIDDSSVSAEAVKQSALNYAPPPTKMMAQKERDMRRLRNLMPFNPSIIDGALLPPPTLDPSNES